MRRFVALLLLCALLLAGCQQSTATATQVACSGLTGLEGAIGAMAGFSPDTAVADALAYQQKIDPLIRTVRPVVGLLGVPVLAQVITAYDLLNATLHTLPEDATLGVATATLNTAVSAMRSAVQQAHAALKCGP